MCSTTLTGTAMDNMTAKMMPGTTKKIESDKYKQEVKERDQHQRNEVASSRSTDNPRTMLAVR